MTEKQTKALAYAGFTAEQIKALETVFPVLPPPERRKEIEGFVKDTVENMNALNKKIILQRLLKERGESERIQDFNDMRRLVEGENDNETPTND